MIQNLENRINSNNQIKEVFGNFFYQIGQEKYQTKQIRQLSIDYRNLTKDLDELGKDKNQQNNTNNLLKNKIKKANDKWNCETQVISNQNNLLELYLNRIENITKTQIPMDQVMILDNYNSNIELERYNAIKMAGILTGKAKFQILEQIEEILQ